MAAELPGFTEGLNRLVGTYRWRTGDGALQTYSTHTLASELRRRGYDYSDSYLHQLRTGAKANPSAIVIAGLSEVFGGLDVRYWFDMEQRIQILRDLDRATEQI